MGRNCLAELSQAISKIEAELLELKNIKAEVDYKELGIDDGTAARSAYLTVLTGASSMQHLRSIVLQFADNSKYIMQRARRTVGRRSYEGHNTSRNRWGYSRDWQLGMYFW